MYTITGKTTDMQANPVGYVVVTMSELQTSTLSNENGIFTLYCTFTGKINLKTRRLGFKESTVQIHLQKEKLYYEQNIALEFETNEIQQVNVSGNYEEKRDEAGMISLNPKNLTLIPSAFGDFNKVISMLPGVVSNNELSSTYSVRGGNYDENLVYVNGIEIYRPFLVASGQQEGLSFVNPNLVSEVNFSSGGWQAKYGDKLSSVMNVRYKEPKKLEGSVQAGLLGANVYIGGCTPNQKINLLMGFRHKNSQYLLGALPVQGEYLPTFNDFQGYIFYDLTAKNNPLAISKRTTLGVLINYSGNRYFVAPSSQEVRFGGQELLNLNIFFYGTETMNYDTWQTSTKLTHWITETYKTELFVSVMDSREREYVNLESFYRICDLNPEPGVQNPNKCLVERGAGSEFKYARNSLQAQWAALETRNYYYVSSKNTLEWGIRYSNEFIADKLNEFQFTDSLDYIRFTRTVSASHQTHTHRGSMFFQYQHQINASQQITLGARLGYWDLNRQFLFSPSAQYSIKTGWKYDAILKFATGIYRQPPFYREMRNMQGVLNPSVRAQNAWHILAGANFTVKIWNRPFYLNTEMYGKYMWDVVPYDIDNIRLRYYAQNNAEAYAIGTDFRLNGEFVKGSESWFSLGIMNTEENLSGSRQGWVRRPTNQYLTFAMFFQDHVPKLPAWKVFISFLYGSGLPFGPPYNINNRNVFTFPAYRRVDIGTSYVFLYNDKKTTKKVLESLQVGLDVLNIFEFNNTMSYIWVADYSNRTYAVPNYLTSRFFNLKGILTF